jgi:hypothetical protein
MTIPLFILIYDSFIWSPHSSAKNPQNVSLSITEYLERYKQSLIEDVSPNFID